MLFATPGLPRGPLAAYSTTSRALSVDYDDLASTMQRASAHLRLKRPGRAAGGSDMGPLGADQEDGLGDGVEGEAEGEGEGDGESEDGWTRRTGDTSAFTTDPSQGARIHGGDPTEPEPAASTTSARDTAASSPKGPSPGSAAAPDALISSFADLRPHLKRFVRSVHPDVVYSVSDAVRATNNESLLRLNALFSVVEDRCLRCSGERALSAAGRSATTGIPTLAETYHLTFFWLPAGVPSSAGVPEAGRPAPAVLKLTHEVRPSATLDGQTRLVGERGVRSPALLAQWLALATHTLSELLSKVSAGGAAGPPASTHPRLVLDPSLEGADRVKARGRPRLFAAVAAGAPFQAPDLLRENLARWSPIQQGKIHDFPKPGPLMFSESESVFSDKQRKSKLGALYRRGCLVADSRSLPPGTDPAHALHRLVDFFTRHYDRHGMYLDAWFTITLVLGRVYMAVPSTRTLHVPCNFLDSELDDFLREHVPVLLEDASMALQKTMKRRAAANHRMGKRAVDDVRE